MAVCVLGIKKLNNKLIGKMLLGRVEGAVGNWWAKFGRENSGNLAIVRLKIVALANLNLSLQFLQAILGRMNLLIRQYHYILGYSACLISPNTSSF